LEAILKENVGMVRKKENNIGAKKIVY